MYNHNTLRWRFFEEWASVSSVGCTLESTMHRSLQSKHNAGKQNLIEMIRRFFHRALQFRGKKNCTFPWHHCSLESASPPVHNCGEKNTTVQSMIRGGWGVGQWKQPKACNLRSINYFTKVECDRLIQCTVCTHACTWYIRAVGTISIHCADKTLYSKAHKESWWVASRLKMRPFQWWVQEMHALQIGPRLTCNSNWVWEAG